MQPKNRNRILALDVGLKRIGLAISDEMKIIASPLENVGAEKSLETTIEKVVAHIEMLKKERHYVIEKIVVGLPLKLDGSESDITQHARAFFGLLSQKASCAVELFDERLTSVQADRALQEFDFTRKKRAQFVDRVSASILLQSYLDRRGHCL